MFSFVGEVDVLHCFGHGMARPYREEWHARAVSWVASSYSLLCIYLSHIESEKLAP
jgi:hypothetical protein